MEVECSKDIQGVVAYIYRALEEREEGSVLVSVEESGTLLPSPFFLLLLLVYLYNYHFNT